MNRVSKDLRSLQEFTKTELIHIIDRAIELKQEQQTAQGQEVVDGPVDNATAPVHDALTDVQHTFQVLCDLMTILEKKGVLEDLHIAWIGNGNSMANFWIQAAAVIGFELTLACPRGYEPASEIFAAGRKKAKKPITLVRSPEEAVRLADVINVGAWAEGAQQERLRVFAKYQLNSELLAEAPPDCIVLHSHSAHREEEITEEVLESVQCVAFDQAENTMHVHKAILESLTGK